MDNNAYRGQVFRIDSGSANPPIYFLNLFNTDGTDSPNERVWSEESYEKARTVIGRVIESDALLRRKDIAKFVIAFGGVSFAVYTWGDGEEPDFNCIKHGEYEFGSEERTREPITCPLENQIKARESTLWCSDSISTIRDYYLASRDSSLALRVAHPNKPWDRD